MSKANSTSPFREMFKGMDWEPPASQRCVRTAEKTLKLTFPHDYREFLRFSNGIEGVLGKSYVALWSCKNLIEYNIAYNVETNNPYLRLFGSDGAGEAYGFDLRKPGYPIVNVPFITLSFQDSREMSVTFSEFIDRLKNIGW